MDTQYIQRDERFDFSGDVDKHAKLPSGVYKIDEGMTGLYLIRQTLHTDTLVKMPNSVADEVNQIVDGFLTGEIKEAFDRYGILYKRGLLMYGPPGTGKTCIINQLVEQAEAKEMIVFLDPMPHHVKTIVSRIRGIESDDRPVMVIWEEFENWVYNYEAQILNLLDGVSQISNAVYIATTNYIEKVPQRIRNRPSRFADVIQVGYPSAEVRKIFLSSKIHETDNVNLDEWVERTHNLTIDHLKDLIISVLVLKIPFEVALGKLRNLGKEVDSDLIDDDDWGDDCVPTPCDPQPECCA